MVAGRRPGLAGAARDRQPHRPALRGFEPRYPIGFPGEQPERTAGTSPCNFEGFEPPDHRVRSLYGPPAARFLLTLARTIRAGVLRPVALRLRRLRRHATSLSRLEHARHARLPGCTVARGRLYTHPAVSPPPPRAPAGVPAGVTGARDRIAPCHRRSRRTGKNSSRSPIRRVGWMTSSSTLGPSTQSECQSARLTRCTLHWCFRRR